MRPTLLRALLRLRPPGTLFSNDPPIADHATKPATFVSLWFRFQRRKQKVKLSATDSNRLAQRGCSHLCWGADNAQEKTVRKLLLCCTRRCSPTCIHEAACRLSFGPWLTNVPAQSLLPRRPITLGFHLLRVGPLLPMPHLDAKQLLASRCRLDWV